jgi:predicted ATPase/DNA-binding CsgD family transcriptional regulator
VDEIRRYGRLTFVASPSQLLSDAGVSAREAEILAALGERLTNAEIAARHYISVRTVESHVSSLLRKLGVSDRRALAEMGAELGADLGPGPAAPSPLPSPLTSFVGRAAERAALAAALEDNRLVTAVGPGGVGKTRLALAVAADLADRYGDGVWYVDLVPVTDPAMIASSVASVLDLGGSASRPAIELVEASLADREALLVLDNCEHLVDGVVVFVERLLARCPRLVVLTTSRARLVVPFERVFPVPGLSLSETGDEGDAEALFLARAAAVGSPVTDPGDRRRVAEICRALDGLALAIELAAARLPTLGFDGLEAGLADPLRLLSGGSRLDERHRSVRATLDWSYALADPVDQALLRRVSVFAAPFTAEAAAAVAGFPPVSSGPDGEASADATDATADALGRLAEQSLVVVVPGRGGTRYRALESIRQYGADRLDEAGEGDAVRERHLRWCAAVAAELGRPPERAPDRALGSTGFASTSDDAWWGAFDAVADDLRAALRWASEREDRRAEAHDLAVALGGLAYRRGLSREAQHRYEDAAALTEGRAAAAALHHAAGAASSRQAGDEAIALHRQAADTALAAGDGPAAARDLALLATLVNRGPGILTQLPPPVDVNELIAEARPLAAGHPDVEAAVLVAEVFELDEYTDRADELARRAVEMAEAAGDPLVESAALDALTAVQLARAEPFDAAATIRRRMDLLAPLPPHVDIGFEVIDGHHMATETHLAIGDLRTARRYAEQAERLPALREGHLGGFRHLIVDALAGDWDAVPPAAERFRANWERVGRPVIGTLATGAGATALVHGMRGDQAGQDEWLEVTAALRSAIESYGPALNAWAPTYDAHLLVHQGRFDEAVARMELEPEELNRWYTGMWRQWYTALWAEAGALAEVGDADDRLARARPVVAGNPVAAAIVDRTDALVRGDRSRLLAAAEALDAAACRYQWARTLVLAGGPERTEGEQALAALGAIPMALPPLAA